MRESDLIRAGKIFADLRASLKDAYQLEDGDEALETTLEGATNLPEMLAAAMRRAFALEIQTEAIMARIALMRQRATRLIDKKDAVRVAVLHAMEEAGLRRIPADALPEMTVSLSGGRAPLSFRIKDSDVPDNYCRITKEPDRQKIRTDLERGARLDWVELGNPQKHLIVKAT